MFGVVSAQAQRMSASIESLLRYLDLICTIAENPDSYGNVVANGSKTFMANFATDL